MTPEQINIAIAEWCGWKYHKPTEEELKSGSYYQFEPDYYHNLNAVHKLETLLNIEASATYEALLDSICNRPFTEEGSCLVTCGWHATAPQRCEALLRTLNLWKEPK